jgi:tetratricopeptide (TPR) repeat protein
MSGEFIQSTKNTLAKRAGEMCSMCKRNTSKAHTNPEKFVNLGEAAHIKGRNEEPNNRFDSNITAQEIKHVTNGIWLCPRCHKEIDSDGLKYTVDILVKLKSEHEKEVAEGLYAKSKNELEIKIESLEKLILEKEKSLSFAERLLEKEIEEKHRELNLLRIKLEKQETHFENTIEDAYVTLYDSSYKYFKEIVKLLYQGKYNEADELLDVIQIEKDVNDLKEQLTQKANLLILKADIAIKKGDLKAAHEYFNKSIELCENFYNLNSYSRFLNSINEFGKGIEMLNKAILVSSDYHHKAAAYNSKGNTYKSQLKTDLAFIEYQKAIDIYVTHQTSKNHDEDISVILNNIGLSFNSSRNYNDAIINYLKSIRLIQGSKNHLSIAKTYVNMGSSFLNKNYLKCTLKSFSYALELCEKSPSNSDDKKLIVKIAQSGIANYYYNMDNMVKALHHYELAEKALTTFSNTNNRIYLTQLSDLYHNMAAVYHYDSNTEKAILYYKKNLEIETKNRGQNPIVHDRKLCITYFNLGMIMLKENKDELTALNLIVKSRDMINENNGFDLNMEVIKQIRSAASFINKKST